MRAPLATYRLQLNNDFTLQSARAVVPYLARLGISDLYLSPIFEARTASTHGYDVTDPTRVRASLGGADALYALAETAREHGLGILLDIVPNHMAASSENPWWQDVLRNGRHSAFAHFFDIDWERTGRVLLPILADTVAALVDRNEITLDAAARTISYHHHQLPLAEGTFSTTDSIPVLLEQQHYQLVHWQRAAELVGYRRFFDISDLVGVRIEDPDVFDATHSLVRRLATEGVITGLRIDHIDGLRDPEAYLSRLRSRIRGPDGEPLFTVVEKILQRDERLPQEWSCDGTTGYEFLPLTSGLLIEPSGHTRIELMYRRLTADDRSFEDVARDKKLLVTYRLFAGELARLAADLSRQLPCSVADCTTAVAEVTASLRVYRTYLRSTSLRDEDRTQIENAVADALEHQPAATSVLQQLRQILLLQTSAISDALDWVMRWQQFTGPVMAKGVEDTALYCRNALLAVNEVGAHPSRPCLSEAELHLALSERRRQHAGSLNATATHDTKRGEDTRARLAVLSEVADEWRHALRHWLREGDEWKADLADEEDHVVADADVDSMLYQTLIGTWPLTDAAADFTERIQHFMTKAVREAKKHTSWRRPNEDYEEALTAFVAHLIRRSQRPGLPEQIAAFARRIAAPGALNSLAQQLIKLTAPGVPDVYQGTELWSLTLVDPDNRRPVDYEVRRRQLDEIASMIAAPDPLRVRALLDDWQDGRIKLWLTTAALHCRARHRAVFEHGEIVPLSAIGDCAGNVFAYSSRHVGVTIVVALTRWSSQLTRDTISIEADRWGNTSLELPSAETRSWRNAVTGERIRGARVSMRVLFATAPFALLEPVDA